MRKIFIVGLFLSPLVFYSQIDSINVLKPAAVSAVTADERSPFAHTNLDSEDLNARDSGQDLPFLLRLTPLRNVFLNVFLTVLFTNNLIEPLAFDTFDPCF